MTTNELLPTICGYHWLPVFAARPRINKLSLQLHELIRSSTNNPPVQRELKDSPSRDIGEPPAATGGNSQLRESDPNAGVVAQAEGQPAQASVRSV